MSEALPVGSRFLIGAFATSGVIHLVAPQVFEPLIPAPLGEARPWVYGSGAAELVCAAGLATRRRWAPAATAATLAAVWVGNLHMARKWQASARPAPYKAAAWARLPLQAPLIKWALESPVREV